MTYSSIPSITVEELAVILANEDNKIQFIDVREPEEIAIAFIPQFKVLPLSQYPQWSTTIKTDLDLDTETIVMCHHGVRSAQMSQWLINQGFSNVKNLTGGIDAYSLLIDDNIPRY
jgi:rhodanese-related sulfurtransferase